jgi:hypothetical protein
MRAKVFEINLGRLPVGRSPASYLELRINDFLEENPQATVEAIQISNVLMPHDSSGAVRPETWREFPIMIAVLLYSVPRRS